MLWPHGINAPEVNKSARLAKTSSGTPRRPPRHHEDLPARALQDCPKFFLKNRANKRFCSDACRKEFFEYGGTAFNQLKPKLEKFVTRWMREYAAHIEARLTAIESKLEQRQQ